MTAGLRQLLTLAWPIVLARSAQAAIGFADAAMIAHLGEDALAATTTGALNAFGLMILPMGIVFIVQSFAAQLAGQRDLGGARRFAWYGLLLAAVTQVLAIAAIPLIGLAVAQLNYTPAVQVLLTSYVSIRLLGVGAAVATEALGNWYGGLGDTRLSLLANVTAMVANIGLNWLLIYGHLGLPALGVEGAAIASVIATWLGLLVVAVVFARGYMPGAVHPVRDASLDATPSPLDSTPSLHDPTPSLHDATVRSTDALAGLGRLRWPEFTRMLRFGLPNGLNWFLEFSAFLVFINLIFADLGTLAVAALMAVFQVNSISFMPAFGLSSAGAILVGQAIGAGEPDRVPAIVKRTMLVAASWQGMVGIIYLLLPVPIMAIFARDDLAASELARLGAVLLAISAAWQLFDAVVMTLSEALRAAGDTAWVLWARVGLAWLVWLPLSLWVVHGMGGGPPEATACMVVYFVALSLAIAWRFRTGAWRRIDLTGAHEPHLT
jgi:MATE family multidrug resistance protein